MLTKDKELLNKLSEQVKKMRGIETAQTEPDKVPENTTGEVITKIKSIPLGVYVDTEGNNKARIK